MAGSLLWIRSQVAPAYTAPTWRAGGFQFLEGTTITRVIFYIHFIFRYFTPGGPPYDAPNTIVAGALYSPGNVTAPTTGPVSNPELDWLWVGALLNRADNIPVTGAAVASLDARLNTDPVMVDVAGQRRVGAAGARVWLLAQLPDLSGFPAAGSSASSAYLSVLARTP